RGGIPRPAPPRASSPGAIAFRHRSTSRPERTNRVPISLSGAMCALRRVGMGQGAAKGALAASRSRRAWGERDVMELELHQLDLRYQELRTRQPTRERRLVASLAEIGQQTPIAVV